MNIIPYPIRRWGHAPLRHAHRHELPRIRDWLGVIAFLLALSAGWFEADTWRLRVEARDQIVAAARISNCINGKSSLGEYTEKDGTRWAVMCSVYERRVSGHAS